MSGPIPPPGVSAGALAAALAAERVSQNSTYVRLAPPPTGGDDTASLTAALPILHLHKGTWHLGPIGGTPAAGIIINAQSRIDGQGASDAYYQSVQTELLASSWGLNAITLNAGGCILEDFALKCTGGDGGQAGIYSNNAIGATNTTPGGSTKLRGLTVAGFYDNIRFWNDFLWEMDGCLSLDAVGYGLRIDHSAWTDNGDMSVSNCQFLAGPSHLNPLAAVKWQGGGGMKFVNNKINAVGGYGAAQWGIGVDINADQATGDTLIGNCSVENWSNIGIRVNDAHSNLLIHDTQIAGYDPRCTYGVFIASSTHPTTVAMVYRASLSGLNVWVPATATNAISVNNCQNLIIEGCTLDNSGGSNAYIHVGPTVKSVSIGRNEYQPGASGTTTKILQLDQAQGVGGQLSGSLDWALPSIADNGIYHDVWVLDIADGTSTIIDFTASVSIAGVGNTTVIRQSRVLKRSGAAIFQQNLNTDLILGPQIDVNWNTTATPGKLRLQLSVNATAGTPTGTSGNTTLAWSGGHPASISAVN